MPVPWKRCSMLVRPKGEETTGARGARPVRSFVLISRLLIKPQPPKNKAGKGDGGNGMGWRGKGRRVGIFPYHSFPGYRNGDRDGETLDWGEGTVERAGQRNEGRREGAVELKGIKRHEKERRERGKERERILIQSNRNNYGDARGIREWWNDFYRAPPPLPPPPSKKYPSSKATRYLAASWQFSQIIIVWRDTKRLSSASCVSPRIQFHAASFKSLCHPR